MLHRALLGFATLLLAHTALATPGKVGGQPYGTELLPDGATITPLAAPGTVFQALPTNLRPDYTANANGAVTAVLSPDGTALAIITSGYNTFQGHANDYTNKTVPVGYGNASVYGFTGLAGSTIPFDWNGNPRNISVALPPTTKGTPGFTRVRMTTLLDPTLRSG